MSDNTNRFDSELAVDVSSETYAPPSDAGNSPPRVMFEVDKSDDRIMTAQPPGARIDCVLETDANGDSSAVDITTEDWSFIARITVWPTGECSITEETIAIASALYWSWWRARDMAGEAPVVSFADARESRAADAQRKLDAAVMARAEHQR